MRADFDVAALDFAKGGGLVTVVAQDAESDVVLMVAHANADAIAQTIASGEMHYTSRTRGPWHKGATSGNIQRVVSLHADCDGDVVLARVTSVGPACHTGVRSCFGDTGATVDALDALDATIAARAADADREGQTPSYTRQLLSDRNLRLKKLGEEAAELVAACADGDSSRATDEVADLVYHALVALRATGGTLAGVRAVLAARHLAPRS